MSLFTVALLLNSLSLVASLLVVVTLACLCFFQRISLNRVSLRLQASCAIVLVLYHAVCSFSLLGVVCASSKAVGLLFEVCYLTLNLVLALNLGLMFLLSISPRLWWEKLYWALTVGISLAVASLTWALEHNTISEDHPLFHVYKLAIKYQGEIGFGARLLGVGFCFLIALATLTKILTTGRPFGIPQNPFIPENSAPETYTRHLKYLVASSAIYLLGCFFTQLGCITEEIARLFFNTSHEVLADVSLLGKLSAGTLGLVAFLYDPDIHQSLHTCLQEKFPSIRKRALYRELQEPSAR